MITIKEFKKLKNITLIDIREPEEYKTIHIPNSINIPKDILLDQIDKYITKNQKFYIVCRS